MDRGGVVLAHVIRGAIHAVPPGDFGLYGRSLITHDDEELGVQLGRQVQRLTAESGLSPRAALEEVAVATRDALGKRGALHKNSLHEDLRARVNPDLMPWCRGCGSHHVAPMLWRYATIEAGARLDSERRYRLGDPGQPQAPSEIVRRFLGFYGPSRPAEFAEWAGLARSHAQALWDEVETELVEMPVGGQRAWLLAEDVPELESPPPAEGVRLIPPGDPYLQKPNRPLLARPELRKRLFRPVASPGAVLREGRLAGLWRMRLKGMKAAITVEKVGRLARTDLEEEAQRTAQLRGATQAVLTIE